MFQRSMAIYVRSPLVYSPNGSRNASGSNDNTVRVWEPQSCSHIAKLDVHMARCIGFSSNGFPLSSCFSNGALQLWDSITGKHTVYFGVGRSPSPTEATYSGRFIARHESAIPDSGLCRKTTTSSSRVPVSGQVRNMGKLRLR
jgi:WD40 repeat protein